MAGGIRQAVGKKCPSRTDLARVGGDVPLAGGSVADGRRQAGSGRARSRARALLNWASQGQRWGRCRVATGRAGEASGEGEEPSSEGLGGHHRLTQTEPRRPASQVMCHHLYGQPDAVGGEVARGVGVCAGAPQYLGQELLDAPVAWVVEERAGRLVLDDLACKRRR